MKRVQVQNMRGSSGREVPNQFIIFTEEGVYFQSYNSVIAFKDNQGNVFLDHATWDYSRTTGKYRNIFLRETKAETVKKIESGEYKLRELNR